MGQVPNRWYAVRRMMPEWNPRSRQWDGPVRVRWLAFNVNWRGQWSLNFNHLTIRPADERMSVDDLARFHPEIGEIKAKIADLPDGIRDQCAVEVWTFSLEELRDPGLSAAESDDSDDTRRLFVPHDGVRFSDAGMNSTEMRLLAGFRGKEQEPK